MVGSKRGGPGEQNRESQSGDRCPARGRKAETRAADGEYGKFVRLAANRRDAAERARFAKKAEAALRELNIVKREAGRRTKW